MHLNDSFASWQDFANRLSRISIVDASGTTWTTAGTFVPTQPKKKVR